MQSSKGCVHVDLLVCASEEMECVFFWSTCLEFSHFGLAAVWLWGDRDT